MIFEEKQLSFCLSEEGLQNMCSIINRNQQYWAQGNNCPNVDSYVFRFYGRILKHDFNMPKSSEKTTLLDFGCGQGAAVNYFNELGFSAFGCDSSKSEIDRSKSYFPKLESNFFTIPSDTTLIKNMEEIVGFSEQFDVITSFQTLYYLPKVQFEHFIHLAHGSLKKGGVFFATMISEKHELFFDNSFPCDCDDWMKEIKFKNSRQSVSDYYIHFVKDKADLISKFKAFEPLHIGEYMNRFHTDDGSGHHYTFCGLKL